MVGSTAVETEEDTVGYYGRGCTVTEVVIDASCYCVEVVETSMAYYAVVNVEVVVGFDCSDCLDETGAGFGLGSCSEVGVVVVGCKEVVAAAGVDYSYFELFASKEKLV